MNKPLTVDPAVQDRIWDYFQNDAAESFAGSHSRLAFLARQLRPPCKVLDIGVGSGLFEAVTYIGAVPPAPADNWMTGWTSFPQR